MMDRRALGPLSATGLESSFWDMALRGSGGVEREALRCGSRAFGGQISGGVNCCDAGRGSPNARASSNVAAGSDDTW